MKLLWFEDQPGCFRLRERGEGEEGGRKSPPREAKSLIYPPLDRYPASAWPEVEDRPIAGGGAPAVGAVIGSGDTTNSIYGQDGRPYRFKEGTKSGQKAEIRAVMEKRFQENNKAPWRVGVDVYET